MFETLEHTAVLCFENHYLVAQEDYNDYSGVSSLSMRFIHPNVLKVIAKLDKVLKAFSGSGVDL
jgi:hypothetical protein